MNDVTNILSQFIPKFLFVGKWYLICLIIFFPLALLFPNKKSQGFIRAGMLTDTLYWFLGGMLNGFIFKFIVLFLLSSIHPIDTIPHVIKHGMPPIATLPLWVQMLLLLFITDFLQYWVHRLFHQSPWWEIHAIHHSSKEVDWLSAARIHPINFIFYTSLINALVFILGFHPDTFVTLMPFLMVYPSFVHANLNWRLGPFRYILASPVFHRWHHTLPEEGGNKNFAPTFPILDIIFGTYYDPKHASPERFGLSDEKVSNNLMQQILCPFWIKAK